MYGAVVNCLAGLLVGVTEAKLYCLVVVTDLKQAILGLTTVLQFVSHAVWACAAAGHMYDGLRFLTLFCLGGFYNGCRAWKGICKLVHVYVQAINAFLLRYHSGCSVTVVIS
jgi:hypothetical protein